MSPIRHKSHGKSSLSLKYIIIELTILTHLTVTSRLPLQVFYNMKEQIKVCPFTWSLFCKDYAQYPGSTASSFPAVPFPIAPKPSIALTEFFIEYLLIVHQKSKKKKNWSSGAENTIVLNIGKQGNF